MFYYQTMYNKRQQNFTIKNDKELQVRFVLIRDSIMKHMTR